MSPRSFVTFAGFIMLIAGIFSPIISPLGLVKWNLFDLNKTFAIVLLVVAIAGLAGTIIKSGQLARLCAWISLALVILLFVAVKLEISKTFSFIHFPKLAQTLSGFIHYRWGWYLLSAGPVLALLGSLNRKSIHSKS
jgi:hypothetical protein